jgi:hypothetical protein
VQLPPQSTSVSSPFFTLSSHCGLTLHLLPAQSCHDSHCEFIAQNMPQLSLHPLLQSTPCSAPFLILSSHVGQLQRSSPFWRVQSPKSMQSFQLRHFWPCEHGSQSPPQSTSVSEPSSTPLLHPAIVVQLPAVHRSQLWQSLFCTQVNSQLWQSPPQSTPVSPPFFRPSSQLIGWHMLTLPCA